MSLVGTLAQTSSVLQIGGSALSLVGATKALVSSSTPRGIAGFLFDIPMGERVTLTSEITDHWTETNVSIQDHMAIAPAKIQISGIVAELVYTKDKVEKYVAEVLARLAPLGILSPVVSQSAQKYLSEYSRLSSALSSTLKQYNDLESVFTGDPAKNNQQKVFEKFESYLNNRALLTVETPWKTYENMALESVTFEQDDSTKDQSTVTLVFKQINAVSTTAAIGQLSGRYAAQISDTADKGTATGTKVDQSVASQLTGYGK